MTNKTDEDEDEDFVSADKYAVKTSAEMLRKAEEFYKKMKKERNK